MLPNYFHICALNMTVKTKAHLALLTVAVMYSLNYIVAKEVMPQSLPQVEY